jgi:hypothetical protein
MNMNFRLPLARLAAMTIAIGALGIANAPHSDARSLPHRACPAEDSINCVWDAKHEGNGKGHSFWVGKAGKVHFISHLRAHTLIHGVPAPTQGRPLA